MKVLVTGGAGFVGSHLAEELVKRNHKVTIIDNYSTGRVKNLNKIMNDVIRIRRTITKVCFDLTQYDAVFHLAAKPFSKEKDNWFSESYPIFQTNCAGTHNILRLTKKDCHFIFASSASVYGEGERIAESMPYNPQSAYGYTKMIAEQIIKHSTRPHTILRPGTIIGPRGRCFPNRVMWSIVNNVKCNFFKNGYVLRDIIDVRDVVSAMIGVMEQQLLGIYNLGSNSQITGIELALHSQKISERNNVRFTPRFESFVPDDFVVKSTLNSDKLCERLNWKPRFILPKSLDKIFEYYKQNPQAKEPPSWDSL